MCLTFREYQGPDWTVFTVHHGRTLIAKSRYQRGSGTWLLKLYGASWLDPRAREPNRMVGRAMPEYLVVKRKREARKIMQELAKQGT